LRVPQVHNHRNRNRNHRKPVLLNHNCYNQCCNRHHSCCIRRNHRRSSCFHSHHIGDRGDYEDDCQPMHDQPNGRELQPFGIRSDLGHG
jgi:hypothetical protein